MKRWSVVLIIFFSLAAKLFCYGMEDTPKEKCFTQFEENENLYVIYYPHYRKENQSIIDKAYEEGKFVLHVGKKPFKAYFTEFKRWDSQNSPFSDLNTPDLEKFLEILKTDTREENGPTVDFVKRKIIEKKNGMIEQVFSTRTERLSAHPLGSYAMDYISKDGYVYYYWLEDPNTDHVNKVLNSELSDYIYKSEKNGYYYWKSQEALEAYYEDLSASKSTLPEYVLKFQQTWESIINSIE